MTVIFASLSLSLSLSLFSGAILAQRSAFAANKGFLSRGTKRRFPPTDIENTFEAIQSTFSYLEVRSMGAFKICTCFVILGELQ